MVRWSLPLSNRFAQSGDFAIGSSCQETSQEKSRSLKVVVDIISKGVGVTFDIDLSKKWQQPCGQPFMTQNNTGICSLFASCTGPF